MEILDIDTIRKELHRALINKLVALYQNPKWKYRFIKNARNKFNHSIQWSQLNKFESGNPRNEMVLNVMLLEILSYEKAFDVEITRQSIKIRTKK